MTFTQKNVNLHFGNILNMKLFRTKKELLPFVETLKKQGKTIGFVPTMGALHQGHLSLIEKSLSQNDFTFVSIFVNPTQFNNAEDLQKYPRDLDSDLAQIQSLSPERIAVFAPSVEDMYGQEVQSEYFDFHGVDKVMEGASRAGHFDGVGTIVKKLFQIITPDRAYFGEKDYQQIRIVQLMVAQSALPVQIVPCPIVREPSGLAMSSRNRRLSPQTQERAACIYQFLLQAQRDFPTKSIAQLQADAETFFKDKQGFDLEYFTIASEEDLQPATQPDPNKKYRAFIVVWADEVRLIDNIALY